MAETDAQMRDRVIEWLRQHKSYIDFLSYSLKLGSSITINENGVGDRYAYIDFVSDDTYTDFGLRVIRSNAGENAPSAFQHRGTGALRFETQDEADIEFLTQSVLRFKVTKDGGFVTSSQVGITAHAGGGQANAIEITKSKAEISICATAADSVKLPSAVAGMEVKIINRGAQACDVFPNTDDNINEGGANNAKSLGVNATFICTAIDATHWEVNTLAR